ncbi:c-type cytochrome [Rhodovarius crocodyli]|uniref:C-type cytochrome n=1 Tax=Rhodovarius crocodyli TaxID=1979269 RepID=A0A437MDV7_9PROT|nr:c-type cytochrome [Rhodovarius crocodyli]RVT95808.1 c-type cytochrome [Rhodovarius crocodyli]
MGIKDALARLRSEARDLGSHIWLNRPLVLGTVAAGLLGAGLFAWSGAYDIAASKGHWAIFEHGLRYGMRQSVATHSMGIVAPPLDDEALVRRGAGHYQGGCAPCHGAPGRPPNPITRAMLPEPPELGPRIAEWRPEELFRLVMHGIKYTGMPAWPAQQRPDEVWSVVAFLRRIPGMEETTYRRLAFGELADERERPEDAELTLRTGPAGEGIAACARCHGQDGQGTQDGAFPRISGQSETYLRQALHDYASGARPSGIMGPIAAGLTRAEIEGLARHYAHQPRPPAAPGSVERGRLIAEQGLPDRRVAACQGCHDGRNPAYPNLAGQHPRFIEEQLVLWMQGGRSAPGSTEAARIMFQAVGAPRAGDEHLWTLTRGDIRAVAAWYAGATN